ncbi:hypothetical protein E2C01_088097 [Portunus trituberculatus]|uniref:Uncharacterized protein n=1 Tax=Portunus trituberculatus TaxID=210409 RepID=A0A5B7J9V4_PORTR|nr:hypothetical protein [Portunus trituberculatus]
MRMTGFFLIAQMAGAGFLALPRATADTGGQRRWGSGQGRAGKNEARRVGKGKRAGGWVTF